MQSYTEGYVTELPYTYGYYEELNPLRAAVPILWQNVAVPRIRVACELGFGQGLSINMHAAASHVEWWGTDFNPTQVNFARELASKTHASPHLCNEAFARFCRREDLPEFDFIGIHGIWSWINDENKALIVEFIKNKLAVGGILYISYNCLPGWATMLPVRDLMAQFERCAGANLDKGIDEVLKFAEKLESVNATYFKSQPLVQKRLELIKKQSHAYLAHEYFNKSWDVMSFATMAEWLAPAMVDYVCPAPYIENVNVLNFSKEQSAFLAEIEDMALRETARDLILNTQFRRDYWIKGKRKLSSLELRDAILPLRFVLTVPLEKVDMRVSGFHGEANLDVRIYEPILKVFSDNQPHALAELMEPLAPLYPTVPQILECVTVLCAKKGLAPALEPDHETREHCAGLNAFIENLARSSADINFLASPLTGGGLRVGRFSQLFILGLHSGVKDPEQLAQFVWRCLAAMTQKIILDGKILETPEENLAALQKQAGEFCRLWLPIYEKLQVL